MSWQRVFTQVAVYSASTPELVGHVDRVAPECGVDFCDECGDCLRCYGGDPCASGHGHTWIYYENALPVGATLIRKN